MATSSKISVSGVETLDALLVGSKWGSGAAGDAAVVSFAFPTTTSQFVTTANTAGSYASDDPSKSGGAELLEGFSTFTSDANTAARSVLAAWAQVADIKFVESSSPLSATLRFAFSNAAALGETTFGISNFPDSGDIAGDTWMNADFLFPEGWAPGTQNFLTLMHEVGHALGLKHPHDEGMAGVEGWLSTAVVLPFEDDNTLTTESTRSMVMAYTEIAGVVCINGQDYYADFAPTTPMRWDIAAVQYLYGANSSYNSGNTTYSFSMTGQYHQTLYDAGGQDTLVVDGTTGAYISLVPGSWSQIGTPITYSMRSEDLSVINSAPDYDNPETVFIYDTVVIENATGGSGNDTIIGNDSDNTLRGAGGNDTIDGGVGADIAAFNCAVSAVDINFSNGTWTVEDVSDILGVDTITNCETLSFTDRSLIIESKSHDGFDDLPAELYQFFVVAFDAAPGVTYMEQLAEAYRYWMLAGDKTSDQVIKQVVDVFITKSQFTDLYPNDLDNFALAQTLVDKIVKGSASDKVAAQAVTDIKAAFDIGWSRGDVIYTVFGNLAKKPSADLEWGGTSKLFANEIAVSKAYTEIMSQSTTNLSTLKSVLAAISADSDVSTSEKAIELAIAGLLTGSTSSAADDLTVAQSWYSDEDADDIPPVLQQVIDPSINALVEQSSTDYWGSVSWYI